MSRISQPAAISPHRFYAELAAWPRLNPLKAWIGQKTCRVRCGFSCTRKKSKPLPNCPIIRRGFSSGAARATALLKPMGRSTFMANGGGATAKRN